MRVVRVVDGDTIEIEGGQKVRYIGIDTPETVDPLIKHKRVMLSLPNIGIIAAGTESF